MKECSEYFSGKKLYGDNFNKNEIAKWFKDESEGYSKTLKKKEYVYQYHEINKLNGYSFLKNKKFDNVLGLGSAFGEEFMPIINKINKITIIEPSENLRSKKIKNISPKYIKPKETGSIPLKNKSMDLITCFGTLHHIPNVSKVLSELNRVLAPGGYILIREPIVSMGDWRKKRKGLTKRERGIPEKIFDKIINDNDLKIISKRRVLFPLSRRLKFKGIGYQNSKLLAMLDYIISLIFSWNRKYHSTKLYHKIRPQSVFYVLKKSS